MKLIGLDSALAHTGYCVIEDDVLLAYGVIDTQPSQSDFERIAYLHDAIGKLFGEWGAFSANGDGAQVVIEKTDWSRGARNSRADWIIETRARESLAVGVTTAFSVCIETGVTPLVLGPNEWHREIGASRKEGVAAYVATVFADQFEVVCKESQRNGKRRFERIVRERATGKRVPDHITDAIGMSLVAQRRLQLEKRIQRQEQ